MYDIILPFKERGTSEELRYTLRTIEKNVPHRRVIILGDKPRWASDEAEFVKTKISPSKVQDVYLKVMYGCRLEDLTDEVIIFNDDFFCMTPWSFVPEYRYDTLAEHISTLKNPRSWWGVSLTVTSDLLKREGHPTVSYELHKPFLVKPALMAESLKRYHRIGICAQFRSLYGNILPFNDAKLGIDYKLGRRAARNPAIASVLSCTDTGWEDVVASHVRSVFTEPSKFELG